MKKIIETENLTKVYQGKRVVNNVDLAVNEGSIYGFLGPNGAGKSTTMKMILGLIKPANGDVKINGQVLNEKNRLEILRNTGSLIESPAFYPHLSGKENLELVASMKQVPKSQVTDVLKIVGLLDAKDKKAGHYSLGMKQRLGLATALLGYPKLLLLDEPTNGLDPAGIQEMRSLICRLPQQYGMTVLVSSHLLSEIDQMVTDVGIIDKGELIFQDKLETLHETSRPDIKLKTTDNVSAIGVLTRNGFDVEQSKNQIILKSTDDNTLIRMGRCLFDQGIGLLRIVEEQQSLEEIFLGLTGR